MNDVYMDFVTLCDVKIILQANYTQPFFVYYVFVK